MPQGKQGYWGEVGQGIAGFFEELPLVGAFIPDEWSEEEWPLPERPPLGVEARRLQDEHARAVASYTNRMIQSNVATVGQNFASLGRGDSGQRNIATQQAINQATYAGTNVVGQGSLGVLGQLLNAQIAREGMDETRLYNQAQINQQGQGGTMDDLSAILQLYFLSQGIPASSTGGGSAGLTQSYATLRGGY